MEALGSGLTRAGNQQMGDLCLHLSNIKQEEIYFKAKKISLSISKVTSRELQIQNKPASCFNQVLELLVRCAENILKVGRAPTSQCI